MGTRGQVLLGLFLVLLGVIYVLGITFNINISSLCWPVILILIGVFLLARPRLERGGSKIILIGDYRRNGAWPVTNTDLWLGIGDTRLNFSETDIPPGETIFRLNGFVGDFRAEVPAGIPVLVNVSAFVATTKIFGHKRENIFAPIRYQSEGYETAERKLRFEITHFVGDVKVDQA